MAALSDVKVIDLSRYISGPYCGMLLADLGADVTKVEFGSGDPSRREGPWRDGQSLYFAQMNRNKRGVWLDLRSTDGKDALRDMVQQADVLIENLRPGTLDAMGFGPPRIRELNPRCITVSISGFGQTSPQRDRGAFDAVIQSLTGLAAVTGDPTDFPLLIGAYVVDAAAGLLATIGALAALKHREATGEGQVVDISLVGAAAALLGPLLPQAATGSEPTRDRNRDRWSAPADTYRAEDGWVYMDAGSDPFFVRLAGVMQQPELLVDPRFASVKARLENRAVIDEIVGRWCSGLPSAEVERRLIEGGVVAARVNTLVDAVNDPSVGLGDFLRTIAGPGAIEMPVVLAPLRLENSPIELRWGVPMPAPERGGARVKAGEATRTGRDF